MSIGDMSNKPIVWPAKINQVPKELFVREDIFEEELRRIFYGPEWIPVGHVGEIPDKGDFKTYSIGKVPLLIVRDKDDQVHVFYNSCSHRGTQVETAPSGNRKTFGCPYHRWQFDTKGSLTGCPSPDDAYSPGFTRDKYPLERPRMELYYGIIFVTLSPDTPPLLSMLTGLEDAMRNVMGGDGRIRLLGYHKYVIRANWKTFADNDGYHAPLLHTAFRLLNWQGGKGVRYINHRGDRAMQSDLSLPKSTDRLKDPSIIEFKGAGNFKGTILARLFPMFSAVKHLDVINLRFNNPVAVDKTELTFAYFYHEDDDDEMITHRARQSSNLLGPCGMVSMEDAAVFHRLQIGCNTPGMAIFQKGVTSETEFPTDCGQNDETANIPAWIYYRDIMGFAKESA